MVKKILALTLAALMLFSACAVAEEPADNARAYSLSGIYVIMGDSVVDLSALKLELDLFGSGKDQTVLLHLDDADKTIAEVGAAKFGDVGVLHLSSPTLGHQDLGLDFVKYYEKVVQNGIDGLIAMLQRIDAHAVARSIVDFMDSVWDSNPSEEIAQAVEEAEAAEEAAEEEDETVELAEEDGTTIVIHLSDLSVEGDFLSVILDCIGEPQAVTMGGTEFAEDGTAVEIPEAEYTATTINFDMDHITQLLNMIYYQGESLKLGDKMKEANIEVSLTGEIYEGEDGNFSTLSAKMAKDGESLELLVSNNQNILPEGETNTFSFVVNANDETVGGVTFTVGDAVHEGEAFTAASVDMNNVVMLTDMDDDAWTATIKAAFGTLAADVQSDVMNTVFNALMAAPTAAQ